MRPCSRFECRIGAVNACTRMRVVTARAPAACKPRFPIVALPNRVDNRDTQERPVASTPERCYQVKAGDLGQRWMKGVSRELALKKPRGQPVPWQLTLRRSVRLTGGASQAPAFARIRLQIDGYPIVQRAQSEPSRLELQQSAELNQSQQRSMRWEICGCPGFVLVLLHRLRRACSLRVSARSARSVP